MSKLNFTNNTEIIYNIILGFILSEHFKNTAYLFEEENNIYKIFLSFSLFIFLIIFAFNIFISFKTEPNGTQNTGLTFEIIWLFIGLITLFPFYLITNIIDYDKLSDIEICKKIAIYTSIVLLSNLITTIISLVNLKLKLNIHLPIIDYFRVILFPFISLISFIIFIFYSDLINLDPYLLLTILISVYSIAILILNSNYYKSIFDSNSQIGKT